MGPRVLPPTEPIPDQQFLDVFEAEIFSAKEIVLTHLAEGENETVPMAQMYPHGVSDLTFMLYTKIGRVLGYERAGDLTKVYNEVQDILNYAGFLLAYIRFLEIVYPEKNDADPLP